MLHHLHSEDSVNNGVHSVLLGVCAKHTKNYASLPKAKLMGVYCVLQRTSGVLFIVRRIYIPRKVSTPLDNQCTQKSSCWPIWSANLKGVCLIIHPFSSFVLLSIAFLMYCIFAISFKRRF